MKQIDTLMGQVAEAIKKTPLFQEFQAVFLGGDVKETYLWLDEKWRKGELPADLGPLLTDLFFMLH